MTDAPDAARAFVARWVELLHEQRADELRAHAYPEHPDTGPPGMDSSWFSKLAAEGYRVVQTTLKPYVAPNWSILRTNRFHPAPTWWCDLELEHATTGRRSNSFLALAPYDRAGFQCAYYVEIPLSERRKLAPFDLRKEQSALRLMLLRTMKRFAGRSDRRPVHALELHFSPEEGMLGVHFDLDPAAEPGRGEAMTHWNYATTLRPRWPDALERDLILIDPTGARHRPHDGAWIDPSGASAPLERHLGRLLVGLLQALREEGTFDALHLAPSAIMSVEDVEGRFGWPEWERREAEGHLASATR